MLLNVMLGITSLLTSYIVVSSSSIPEGLYCTDYEAEKKTNLRFSFEDFGVPRDCPDCRRGDINVLIYDDTANTSTHDYTDIRYTLNNTVNGWKVIIQPGTYVKRVKRLLGRLNLSSSIWDNGLPYTPIGPYNEDSLVIPIDQNVNATLTYGNCARGLTRYRGSLFYCSLPTSSLLQDIRLQFFESDWPPFVGRLAFLQEMKNSPLLKTVGWIGWHYHGMEAHSMLSLVKTAGTDLSQFLGIESLGNDSVIRTYDFWLNTEPMSYNFQLDEVKIFVHLRDLVEFSRC